MDRESVHVSTSSMSCGVMTLSRIGEDIEKVLYRLASQLYHPSRGNPCAFFIWSDLNDGTKNLTNAQRLNREIRNEGFGLVSVADCAENPRTGNIIVIYTWNIHHAKFKAWYSKERVKKLKQVGT